MNAKSVIGGWIKSSFYIFVDEKEISFNLMLVLGLIMFGIQGWLLTQREWQQSSFHTFFCLLILTMLIIKIDLKWVIGVIIKSIFYRFSQGSLSEYQWPILWCDWCTEIFHTVSEWYVWQARMCYLWLLVLIGWICWGLKLWSFTSAYIYITRP